MNGLPPLSAEELRSAARLGQYAGADAQLDEVQDAAVDWVGSYLGQSPFLADHTSWYSSIGPCIDLGVANVDQAQPWTLQWILANGSSETVTSTDPQGWLLDDSAEPKRLVHPERLELLDLAGWAASPVSARFVAGAAVDVAAASAIRYAVRLLVADLYLRFPSTEPLQSVSAQAKELLAPWQVRNH